MSAVEFDIEAGSVSTMYVYPQLSSSMAEDEDQVCPLLSAEKKRTISETSETRGMCPSYQTQAWARLWLFLCFLLVTVRNHIRRTKNR